MSKRLCQMLTNDRKSKKKKYSFRVGCQLGMFLSPALLNHCDGLLTAWKNYGTASEIPPKQDDDMVCFCLTIWS